MIAQTCALPGVLRLRPAYHPDHRGSVEVIYQRSAYEALGIRDTWVQENVATSRMHVLRGLHAQPGQAKLIRVLAGTIVDVVVDVRPDSPTYRQHVKLTLHHADALYVPAGFAHGFCVMDHQAVVSYLLSEEYAPTLERGYAWNDPAFGITWPTDTPILSARDAAALPLGD